MPWGYRPANLMLRFALEIAGLVGLGVWGWNTQAGTGRWLLMILAPVLAAAAWGVFRVPDDPGPAPVRVPGWLRLALEAAFFAAAVCGWAEAGHPVAAGVLGAFVVLHYATSTDRIARVLRA